MIRAAWSTSCCRCFQSAVIYTGILPACLAAYQPYRPKQWAPNCLNHIVLLFPPFHPFYTSYIHYLAVPSSSQTRKSASQSARDCQSARSSDVVLLQIEEAHSQGTVVWLGHRVQPSRDPFPRFSACRQGTDQNSGSGPPDTPGHKLQFHPFVSSLTNYITIPPPETALLLSISFRQNSGLQEKNPLRRVRTGSPARTDLLFFWSKKGRHSFKLHFRYLHAHHS